jgi:transposase
MMILSAGRGDDMTLTAGDFHKGIAILKATETKMHKTFGGLGKARDSDATETIMTYIKSVGVTTRSVIMSRFYRDVDSGTLRQIEETMQAMKVVEIKPLLKEGDKAYKWVGPK